jgi:hypothetical protein
MRSDSLLVALVVAVVLPCTLAVNTVFLPFNSTRWKLLELTKEVPTAWRSSPNFDFTSWKSTRAPIGYGTFGQPGIATRLSTSPIVSFYVATKWTGNATITGCLLTMVLDGGAVVYINGNEFSRVNMPATGNITRTTFALKATTNLNPIKLPVPDNTFNATGPNVIAVEVHGLTPTQTSLRFDMQLEGFAVPSASPSPSPSAPVIVTKNIPKLSTWK